MGELLQESMCEFAILSEFSPKCSMLILQALLKKAGLGDWQVDYALHMVRRDGFPRIFVFERNCSGNQFATQCAWAWPQTYSYWYQEQDALRQDFQRVLETMNSMVNVMPQPGYPTPSTAPFVMNRLCYIAGEYERQQFPRNVLAMSSWPCQGMCSSLAMQDTEVKEILESVKAVVASGATDWVNQYMSRDIR